MTQFEKKWNKTIKDCKVVLAEHFSAKLKIAEAAIECCYRKDGTPRPREYSLARFAKELGMAHGTLKEWVNLKRTVWDKLSKKNQNPDTFTVYQARTIRKIAGPQAKAKDVNAVYSNVTDLGNKNKMKFRQYIDRLESIKHNTVIFDKIKGADESQLLQMQSLCLEIADNIKTYRKRKAS